MTGNRGHDQGHGRPDHEVFDELAVGWALHALEPEDEALFLRHLPGCAQCTHTVADTTEVMAAMAADLPSAEPSPGLRGRLMDAVERTEQVRREEQPPARVGAQAAGDDVLRDLFAARSGADAPAARSVAGHAAAGRHEQPGWRRSAPAVLAAAAVAAILGLGVWNVAITSSRDEAATLAAERGAVVEQLLQPGSSVMVRMSDDTGSLRAALMTRGEESMVVTQGLDVTDDSAETYVLWGMGSGDPVALATFDVAHSGWDVEAVGSRPTGQRFPMYAVSREPGANPPPTPTEVVARGQAS